MGVPVVTLAGSTHASRVGVSLLSTVGLPDHVAASADEYVSIASAVAGDETARIGLRSQMRDLMRRAALLDARLFASSLEQSVRTAWQALTIDNSR